jgi:hypothetical protein
VISADDPRHGSLAGSSANCAEACCRTAKAAYVKTRSRRIGYGTWNPWVDAEPVRTHLNYLSRNGIGWKKAAQLAGLHEATVGFVLYPRRNNKPATKCRPRTAEALLAVQPTLDNVSDKQPIDATGTARRLRALVAQGHTVQYLGDRLPMHPEAARRLIRGAAGSTGRCTAMVARATLALYDELWSIRPQGRTHDRARAYAESLEWATPGAWDDDTIDDPTVEPNLGDPTADVIDDVLVDRVLAGERARLSHANRAHAVSVGGQRGIPLYEIGRRLHVSHTTVRELAAA